MHAQHPVATGPGITRRHLLLMGAAVPAAAGLLGPLGLPAAHAADGFDGLRARWADYLTGGAGLDATHPQIAARLADLSSRAGDALASAAPAPAAGGDLWTDLPMAGPAEGNISLTYSRILVVATAWATPGTQQHADAGVADQLVAWYRHMSAHWYNLTIRKSGNWWFWEIGIPRTLGDLSVLVDALLTDADRAAAVAAVRRFTPNPNYRGTSTSPETGGNRADKALACLLRGITARDEADMVLARDALSDRAGGGRNSLFRYVTSGNGFYADGSYVDHSYLPYVGTYGNVALSGVARSLMLVTGSPWEVTDPDVEMILAAPERSFAPFVWNGRMLETVRGRAVSREREHDFHDGFTTAGSLLLLATQMPAPYRDTYRSLAKGWLSRCTEDYAAGATLSDLSRALPVLADDGVTGAPEPLGHRQFGAQERMVHRGSGWAYTVATSSRRIGRYEWGNDENNLGWHQGDGAAYLYVDGDQGQFSDDYWPTVDPYRLPGTTASLAPRQSGASGAGTGIPRAQNGWAGGVGLSGRWGTAGMDLTNSLGTVRAKKSWFLLDDAVVALGSDVTVTGSDAETVIENRSFPTDRDPALLLDGARVTGPVEGAAPTWAHVEGVAGYVLLGDGQAVRAQVADRSGSWRDVNSGADTGGSADLRTRRYATVTVQHPAGTTGGRYGYVILPGATAERTATVAADGLEKLDVEVLRQDATAHVVRAVRRGRWFLFAHLFAATDEGPVRATGPCAVLVSGHAREATLAVSSPSRSIEAATVEIDLDRKLSRVTSAHERLTVTGGHVVTVQAVLSQAAGASFEASLAG
ncbi:polysaccharide lyase 8 family protein [Isoptericola sp. NPDC057191]|uniref:polysaccharide lyase 8 family protein n=1 Tax=Isoptericola sp. NPDC057191 TaxID=3346041 RepID=UPI00362E3B74